MYCYIYIYITIHTYIHTYMLYNISLLHIRNPSPDSSRTLLRDRAQTCSRSIQHHPKMSNGVPSPTPDLSKFQLCRPRGPKVWGQPFQRQVDTCSRGAKGLNPSGAAQGTQCMGGTALPGARGHVLQRVSGAWAKTKHQRSIAPWSNLASPPIWQSGKSSNLVAAQPQSI